VQIKKMEQKTKGDKMNCLDILGNYFSVLSVLFGVATMANVIALWNMINSKDYKKKYNDNCYVFEVLVDAEDYKKAKEFILQHDEIFNGIIKIHR
jgi:hypothetical protein